MLPFSDEELQKPVMMVIEKMRPYLITDGGDITILKIQDGKVYVKLEGACRGCPSSQITLKNGIEQALRTEIHPEIEIIHVA